MALLDDLLVMGSPLQKDIRENVEAANISGSISQITQLDITVSDPKWSLLNKGFVRQGMTTTLHGFVMEINSLSIGSDNGIENFSFTARPNVYRNLFNRRGTKVMKNVSPTDFVKAETLAAGGKFVGEASGKRSSVSRDVPQKGETETADNPQSSWTTFGRLANEIGFVMFEACGTIYFAKPSWLIQNLTKLNAYYVVKPSAGGYQCQDIPACNRSEDSAAITVTTHVPISKLDEIRPGFAFTLFGVPTFSGFPYMVSSFSVDLLDPARLCEVQAATPQQDVPSLTKSAGGTAGDVPVFPHIGTQLASDFVYWVRKQVGDRYVNGVSISLSSLNPTVFDGAELAAWAAYQTGVFLPGKPDDQINYCINQGTGASVATALGRAGYLCWAPGVIAITLGGSKVLENVNGRVGIGTVKASRYQKAAKVPGLLY